MLLLPLHRPLTRATFPVVTALLVLINVFVFFGPQAGDEARVEEALTGYIPSRLAEIEAPAYERWLIERGGRADDLADFRALGDDRARREFVGRRTLVDREFEPALRTGRLFPDESTFDEWRRLRVGYDAQLSSIPTLRYLLRASEFDPVRLVSSAFLHADIGHLFGNMLFLMIIGLLVEGALGPWRFLAVYLLGAVGANLASLAFHWGDATGGLGASGAIAALMGASAWCGARSRCGSSTGSACGSTTCARRRCGCFRRGSGGSCSTCSCAMTRTLRSKRMPADSCAVP